MKTSNNIQNESANRVSITTKMAAAFVMAHTFAEVVKSGLFESILYTKTMKSIARRGGCQIAWCDEVKKPSDKVCQGTKCHKDGCVTAIYCDEDLHNLYVTFCPFDAFTPKWHYGDLNEDYCSEVAKVKEMARKAEKDSLHDVQEIRAKADQWTNINEGDRVWCKHYRVMGTITDSKIYCNNERYGVRYDHPVKTLGKNHEWVEETDTTSAIGYLRCGITKNFNEAGEIEGTALYYAEDLRFGISDTSKFVFGPTHLEIKALSYHLLKDVPNGWGVLYAVTISDGLAEGTTFHLDIIQVANMLAQLYANGKGITPTLYTPSEISANQSRRNTIIKRAQINKSAFRYLKGKEVRVRPCDKNGSNNPEEWMYVASWYIDGHLVESEFGITLDQATSAMDNLEKWAELYKPSEITEPAKPSSWMTDYTAEDFQKLQPKYEIHELDTDVMGHRYRSTVSGVGELQVFVSDYAGNEAHALYYIWDEFAGEVKANVRPLDYLRSILTEARGWQRIS